MPRFTTTVFENIQKTPTVKAIRLKFDGKVPFNFTAGQYMFIHVLKNNSPFLKPYSIASTPSQKDYVEFIIKHVENGFVSTYMTTRKSGDKVEMSGPIGRFVLREPIMNDLVFVAVGSGLSSLWSMMQRVWEIGTDKKVWLFFGNRTEDEIIYKEVIEGWAKEHPNFKYIPVVSQPSNEWKGEVGHVQDAMKKYLKNTGNIEIYICGLFKMVEEVKTLAIQMGFDPNRIYFEKYV
jgi:NAD(P)H-flavin reductase